MYFEEALIHPESVIPAQAGIQKNQRTGPRRSQGVTGSTLLRSTPILDPFSGGLQGRFDQRGGETFLPRAGGGEIVAPQGPCVRGRRRRLREQGLFTGPTQVLREVRAQGGLDRKGVAEAVLDIMEGSEQAFKRRSEKYHF